MLLFLFRFLAVIERRRSLALLCASVSGALRAAPHARLIRALLDEDAACRCAVVALSIAPMVIEARKAVGGTVEAEEEFKPIPW